MPRRLSFLALALAALATDALAQSGSPPPAFVDRDKGHCIACHQVPEGAGPATRSDLGPRLEGKRMRELGRAKLRAVIEDPTRANPDTVMPPFGRHRILAAAEIDRIVEYLHALPERLAPLLVAAALALPAHAATPEETRAAVAASLRERLPDLAAADYVLGAAAFDPELRREIAEHASASAAVVEAGKALWTRKFKDGRTLSGCFPNGGRRVAATYPQFDSRLKRVITLEMAVNQCLKAHKEALFEHGDPQTMGVVIAYLRSLSNGQKVAVRVPTAAEARFEEGRRLYQSRMGQRNFACASCHVQGAGKRYANTPLSPAIGQATHWPVVRKGSAVTLQERIRECLELMGAAAFPAGSDELNTIEYFLTFLSNGLPMSANAWRPEKP